MFVNKINLRHSLLNRIGREFGGQSYTICHSFGTKHQCFGIFVWVLFCWGWGALPKYLHVSSHMTAFLFCFLCVWFGTPLTKSRYICPGFIVFSRLLNCVYFTPKWQKKVSKMSVSLSGVNFRKMVRLWYLCFVFPFAPQCGTVLCPSGWHRPPWGHDL